MFYLELSLEVSLRRLFLICSIKRALVSLAGFIEYLRARACNIGLECLDKSDFNLGKLDIVIRTASLSLITLAPVLKPFHLTGSAASSNLILGRIESKAV